MAAHKFGGIWTAVKLDVLQRYLHSFAIALKNKKFRLVYIDAFAGTGECTISIGGGEQTVDGSAKIALDTVPTFDTLHFIEKRVRRAKKLNELCKAQHADRAHVHIGDANVELRRILQAENWRDTRAVLFLDPYGLGADWETLKAVAATEAVDLWYLFSLSGLYRQAANNMAKVDSVKAHTLDRCLGTDEWRSALYAQSSQVDMFAGDPAVMRVAGVPDLVQFVKDRLASVFPAVSNPLILPQKGAPLFALYFAVANHSRTAIALSTRIADYILKMPR